MAKFTTAQLTKARFIRRADLDFKDDGTLFRAWEYAGIIITYTKWKSEYFLSVRVDYEGNNSFTFDDWMKTEEYHLADEFNGCSEIDVTKLIDNIITIAFKVKELNEMAEAELLDMTPVEEAVNFELDMIHDFIASAKLNFDIFTDCKTYDIADFHRYGRALAKYSDSLLKIKASLNNGDMEVKRQRTLFQRVEKRGYVEIQHDGFCFYMKEMTRLVNKYNGGRA